MFRLTVPVHVEVVRSGDLEVAARASSPKLEGTYEYLARGSRLYAVCRAGWSPSSPPLPAGVALANIAAGLDLHPETRGANPFAHLGPCLITRPQRETAGSIDDMVLRSVAWDEREAVVAEVHRLAADLMIDDRGRFLRASPGPHWASFNTWSIEPTPCLHLHPVGQSAIFHSARKDAAYDHLRRHRSRGTHAVHGEIEVLDRGALPDRDAVHNVYGLLSRDMFDLVNGACLSPEPDLRRVAAPVVRAYERLWGWPWSTIADPGFRWPVPQGNLTQTAVDLVAAVEDLRLLVGEACGRLEADELDAWAKKVEPFYGAALVRWDEYELPRLAADAPPPDLEAPLGYAP
ncbi:hypothetical protein [Methylobacterium hispanicum]|uniref:hypothetical protein n=1 Tax=Methylobacterium hispanicum TaxID=270350 RepID=UPI001EE00D9A|nr:hypothetical protein [Methylobacterium hispanicum]